MSDNIRPSDAGKPADQPVSATDTPSKHSYRDEPEVTQEEDVPVDGKDPVGEKMMEQLGAERRQQAEDAK